MIELFNVKSLDDVVFADLEEDKFMQEILLNQAEVFLQKNTKSNEGLKEHGFL